MLLMRGKRGYLVTGTGKPWAAQKRLKAAEFECSNEVLVAAVEKRGLTLPLGSVVDTKLQGNTK